MQESIETMEVPKEALIHHACEIAYETANFNTDLQVKRGLSVNDWGIEEVDYDELEIVGEEELSIRGTINPQYEEKVADATRRNPAEYVTYDCLIEVEILLNLDGLGTSKVRIDLEDW